MLKAWELVKQVPKEVLVEIFEVLKNNTVEGERVTLTDREIWGLWKYREAFRHGLYSDEVDLKYRAI